MGKLAVVYSSDVYVIPSDEVKLFTSNGFKLGGFADSEEEANDLAESFC